MVLNDEGKVSSSFKTQLTVHPLSTSRQPDDASVIYNYRTPLNPGIYQVRVAARDLDSDRTGHAVQWIEIADLSSGKLTLSSLLLNN